ncbi:hypothetical protein K7X08_028693 [Anisodus acutangulus]|uniref:CASP-like protein n=1 Tax=Anisodus acutangulus TaxID=402998 RepID=A0A9Q1KZ79_9SOLA|nr:hypothetical protein K7X08_028693 [Anisodus acutangulus]
MSYLGVGVSPGNVPVYHGNNLKVIDRRVRVTELVLRCVICGLAILGAALIGTDTQVKVIFSIEKIAKFTDMKALLFLVIANGLAAAYSLLQVLRCILSMIRGSVLFNKPLAWAIFSGDQTTSKRVAERKVAKFEKNITRRGLNPLTGKNKMEPAHIVLALFAVLVIGSCKLYNL